MSARFIAFEGGEASGKSTQGARLAAEIHAVFTFEPGGTEIGASIRQLLLDPSTTGLDPRAEALLMAADRAQHVAELVRPNLAAGRHVVTDRYLYSSVAYQGYGRELPPSEVATLSAWATDGLLPDLVVLLDVEWELAACRRDRSPDRIERAGADFHRRVRDGFAALALADPQRWVMIDGSADIEDVALAVRSAVRERLGL